MEERRIVWDESKNVNNKRKHGIGFETARFVFADPNRIWRFDRSEDNASGEDRWQTLDTAKGVTFVVYTYYETEGSNETRIITARLATKAERRKWVVVGKTCCIQEDACLYAPLQAYCTLFWGGCNKFCP